MIVDLYIAQVFVAPSGQRQAIQYTKDKELLGKTLKGMATLCNEDFFQACNSLNLDNPRFR